jgi:DNA-binding NtrC family response regulator
MIDIELIIAEDRPNDIRVLCEGMLNAITNYKNTSFLINEVVFPRKEFEQGSYIRSPMPSADNIDEEWSIENTENKNIKFLRSKDSDKDSKTCVRITVHNFYFYVLAETLYSECDLKEFNDKKESFLRLGTPDYDEISIIETGAELICKNTYSGRNVTLVSDLVWGGDDKDHLEGTSGVSLLQNVNSLDRQDHVCKFVLSSYTTEKESGELTDLAVDLSSRVVHKQEQHDDSTSILTDNDWIRLFNYGVLPFVHNTPPSHYSRALDKDIADLKSRYGFIGDSAELNEVIRQIREVAPSDATVLVQGESGVGKELSAKAIHGESERSHNELVNVNIGAIPEAQIYPELFGAEKGADGSTILLDEIGEMTNRAQVALLRVLENGTFSPLGSTAEEDVDVRVVAATNKDLETEVEAGRFRKDLYYRLDTITVRIPPLRERTEDILPIFDTFLDKFAKEYGTSRKRLTDSAKEALKTYRLPGNVRELRNIAEQIVMFGRNEIIEDGDLVELFKTTEEQNEKKDIRDIGRKESKKGIHELVKNLVMSAEIFKDIKTKNEISGRFHHYAKAVINKMTLFWYSNDYITEEEALKVEDSNASDLVDNTNSKINGVKKDIGEDVIKVVDEEIDKMSDI